MVRKSRQVLNNAFERQRFDIEDSRSEVLEYLSRRGIKQMQGYRGWVTTAEQFEFESCEECMRLLGLIFD